MTVSRFPSWCAALVAIVLAMKPAGAAPRDEADQLFLAHRYEEALVKYDEAYARTRSPAILYNRGRTFEALRRYAEALASFEQFAADAPLSVRSKVPKLEELIADMRAHTTRLVLRCNVNGAKVTLAGKDLGRTPLASELVVDAGSASLAVKADGYVAQERTLALPAGSRLDAQVDLVPEPAARPTAPAPPPSRREEPKPTGITSRWWFWTAVGVVIIGAGVGTYAAVTTERSAPSGNGFSNGQIKF